MRKLTVKRKWSICECASRIRLYVQCAEGEGSHKVNGVSFNEYKLKNGKAVTADIPDSQVAVIVQSSTMSVYYNVPAGTGDVSLLTAPSYNPAQGNPFTIKEQ